LDEEHEKQWIGKLIDIEKDLIKDSFAFENPESITELNFICTA
jgi:hypothetical protein